MITVGKVGAACGVIAIASAALTFVVATRMAPGERQQDPRITEARGRFGW
ncbi:hypothetical protein [Mycobacteroides abscessus]|nr:hypothetical protein [Mycobacteroides abscessus]MDM3919632.1 hypothetical protein [Mycobacteroides abscessus]MDO2963565.1 hypothetical protein [Mycobacteroides abscessus subsp. abscessus]MDO3245276.1 hypothetical protein [Mycobacteroides abscessus subsp. abscessus]MDO3260519.1 hypothetical protein [Mycobacteroides abscessus subsp. abscessus]MDO3307277.1 hypothetical protein [Mycobacteroides abscessus subsp. abscessus]